MSNKSTWDELKEISRQLNLVKEEISDELKKYLKKLIDRQKEKKGASND